MMKTLLALVLAVALAACTTIEKTTRVSAKLQAMQFNDLASRYMERPTFVSVEKMSDGTEMLIVQMTPYGGAIANGPYSFRLGFAKASVPGYVGAIDKYLEWASLAKERKDSFTKEIATLPSWPSTSLKFTFHSGNDNQHFLSINLRSAGLVEMDLQNFTQLYDPSNAQQLKGLLLSFQSGQLARTTDLDATYK